MKCSTCETRTDKRSERMAHSRTTGHDYYIPAETAPVVRTKRDDRVDALVAQGYSRAFAEAFVPMTIAEARDRGLVMPGYQSPIAALATRRS